MADNPNKKKKEKKHWFKDLRAELKKVTWQTPKQLAKNTAAVIVMVLIVAVIVFALDLIFETLNTHGVEKLKSFVTTNETVDGGSNTVVDENSIVNSVDENLVIDNSVESENTVNTENNVEE